MAPLFPYAVSTLFALKGAEKSETAIWPCLTFLLLDRGCSLFAGLSALQLADRPAGGGYLRHQRAVVRLRVGTCGTEWSMAAFWFAWPALRVGNASLSVGKRSGPKGFAVVYPRWGIACLALLHPSSPDIPDSSSGGLFCFNGAPPGGSNSLLSFLQRVCCSYRFGVTGITS